MSLNDPRPSWRNPWPSPQTPYLDPPWLMRGRAVTAWFDVPWDAVASVMSPDLMPAPAPTVRGRLRFYDMRFEGPREHNHGLAPREGQFREGVVAFAARGAELDGEVSLFLWTDSITYLMWGREVFGWPIGLGEITLTGPLWTDTTVEGSSGDASLADQWGSAGLTNVTVTHRADAGTPSGHWLTPRRVLHAAGCDGETRELLVVRPAVRSPGTTWSGTGEVVFDFSPEHPLYVLNALDAHGDFEVADDFELQVGGDVLVAASSSGPS